MSTTVQLEFDGAVARLTLDRAARRNALDDTLLADLEQAVRELRDRRGLRVVVLTGAGTAFCAGVDITELKGLDDAETRRRVFTPIATRRTRVLIRVLDAWRALAPLTIAAVNGPAAGGGFSLMLACDFRVVAAGVSCWFPEVELGVPLSPPSTALLMQDRGLARARDVVLRGRRLDSAALAELGIAHEVVPADALAARVAALVDELARLAPQGAQVSKATLNALAGGTQVLRPELLLGGDAAP
ncbi:MAG: enoyl-CoA hydratase/isomerase family protein [Planctomycetes bacterium]|nr:enoyl-CoA hydratase/isomerase family protein [Planctomycetota bacterium]